jgi:chemotaxis methyl-accepting protein methylase
MLRRLAKTSVGITGIRSLAELRAGRRRGLFGGDRRIAVRLYEEAAREPNGDELTAEILERFGDNRGTFKRTYNNRFRQFDRHVLRILQDNFDPGEQFTVHDAAASDGRTAVDFFELLAPAFPRIEFTASDYSNSVRIADALGGAVVFSEQGVPLEVEWGPFVHNLSKPEVWKLYPLNYLHEQLSLRTIVPIATRKLKAARTMRFYSPRALELQREDPRFRLESHDLLQPLKVSGLHVIRAMNILHDGYFDANQIALAEEHVANALREGGIFISGKNQGPDSPVEGKIQRKQGSALVSISTRG